jgi:UDP-N-acetylmuramoylalanine--D-glutamate ligase
MDTINLKNKKFTVMGLGLHGGGVGVAKWLAQQGAKVLVTDLRDEKILKASIDKLKEFKIEYVLGEHREKDFRTADMIIKNPGVPRESKFLKIARQHHIPIETDMSLFFRMCKTPIIGITGSKGKSTATSIIYEIFKQAGVKPVMAGNIKISPLAILDKVKTNTPVILELSSWQLEDMAHLKRSPNISVITNIFPDHLNRYKSMADYIKAKKIIYQFQSTSDNIVLNYDNLEIKKFIKEIKSQKYWFSTKAFNKENGCFIRSGWIVFRNQGMESIICPVKDIKIPGQHNLENVLASITAAKIYNIDNVPIRKVIKRFKGIPDRLELIRRWKGIKFYNDTTATTPDATIAALNTFGNKVILIAGGTDKRLDYKKLSQIIKDKVAYLVLFKGTASDKIIKHLNSINYKSWQLVENMGQAVDLALSAKKRSSLILLSPAAASFGMFLNEFDRGDQFKKAVKNLR